MVQSGQSLVRPKWRGFPGWLKPRLLVMFVGESQQRNGEKAQNRLRSPDFPGLEKVSVSSPLNHHWTAHFLHRTNLGHYFDPNRPMQSLCESSNRQSRDSVILAKFINNMNFRNPVRQEVFHVEDWVFSCRWLEVGARSFLVYFYETIKLQILENRGQD